MANEIGGPSGGGDDDGGGGVVAGDDGSRNVAIEIGRERPPAFLTKTYVMVDDPNTNSIISWGKSGDSFIIWDHLKFSAEIMTKYFKHNNLASFVYQLNNYGFRKIGVEHQWEYMNPNFQVGKQHLLMNMKRRASQTNPTTRRRNVVTKLSPEMMRDAINESKLEIEKLKMQQLDIDFHIVALEKEARNVESTSRKLMAYWAKACDIIAKRERGESDDDDGEAAVAKRKKSVEETKIETKDNEVDKVDVEMVKEIDCEVVPLSENDQLPSSSSINIDLNSVLDESKSETVVGNFSNHDLDVWTKMLMEDDEVSCEVEVGSETANMRDKIDRDFQEWLIERDNV